MGNALYPDGIDLELLDCVELNNDWISEKTYKCPCGKGKLQLSIDHYNSEDTYYSFVCAQCAVEYEILWGKGVIPGCSPMVRKINNN